MNHDQNFKNLILDYPHQALAFFAAEEAADQLSDAEVTPVRQEQLKGRFGNRLRELDVPLARISHRGLPSWGNSQPHSRRRERNS